MNEDPAKRPKFDMIVPILEKMQDKWTCSPPCPPVLDRISYPRWWCGAYQYCLKLLFCRCIRRHCSFCFWDESSSSHFFYIVFVFLVNVILRFCFRRHWFTDTASASRNQMDWVQSPRLINLWRSAWQSAALLQRISGLVLYLRLARRLEKQMVVAPT